MSVLDSNNRSAATPPGNPGFWHDLWAVLTAKIPGTETREGDRRAWVAILSGMVIPVAMAAYAFGQNQLGYEAMTWLAGLYVAFVALFGVHAVQTTGDVAARMKRIMPLITISCGVTAALVVIVAFILKATGVI